MSAPPGFPVEDACPPPAFSFADNDQVTGGDHRHFHRRHGPDQCFLREPFAVDVGRPLHHVVVPPARDVGIFGRVRQGHLDSEHIAVDHFVEAATIDHMALTLQQWLALHSRPLEFLEVAEFIAAGTVDVGLKAVGAERALVVCRFVRRHSCFPPRESRSAVNASAGLLVPR